jgi:hypothetical protein
MSPVKCRAGTGESFKRFSHPWFAAERQRVSINAGRRPRMQAIEHPAAAPFSNHL